MISVTWHSNQYFYALVKETNIEQNAEPVNTESELAIKDNIEENALSEESNDQEEKEYTSDSVFAKLNELKKED